MGAPALTLSLTLAEAWAIRTYMRRHQEYGCVWERKEMLAIHKAVLHLEENKGEYALEVEEDALWRMEQQIPPQLMEGTEPVGRNLLVKVMKVLARANEPTVDHDDDQPGTNAMPPFMDSLSAELEAAEKGFADYVHDHDADKNDPDYCP